MSCIVRPAAAGDIEAMCALLEELFSIERDFTADRERQAAGLRMLLDRPDAAEVLVAESGGAVIGMCTVQILISTAEGGPVGLVEDLVVSRGHRGKGVGRQLLRGVVERARDKGLARLQLLADKHNAPALSFYRALDWKGTRLVCLRLLS